MAEIIEKNLKRRNSDTTDEEPSKSKRIKIVPQNCVRNNIVASAFECDNLYMDEESADVLFICGRNSVIVPAHQRILAKTSVAFEKLFYATQGQTVRIKVPETSVAAMRIFMQFFYLEKVKFNLQHIAEVLRLTKVYSMEDCAIECGDFWATNVNIKDICWAYRWAIHYEMDEFQRLCEQRICAQPDLVFKSDSFLNCDRVVLDHILDMNSLMCFESIVFGACMEWARKVCERDGLNPCATGNIRKCLKDSLYKIRFGSMTLPELRRHIDKCDGLFVDVREYEDIIRLMTGSNDLRTGRFNSMPRIAFWDLDLFKPIG